MNAGIDIDSVVFIFCSLGANPDFLPATLDEAACVPLSKERRMKFAKAAKFHGKSGKPEVASEPSPSRKEVEIALK